MNLLDVRKLFFSSSGRRDLVNADSSNNGADRFINAGQTLLDSMVELRQLKARKSISLKAGAYFALIDGCRIVEEVWTIGTEGEKVKLEKVPADQLRTYYNEIVSTADANLIPNILNNVGTTYAGTTAYYGIIPVSMAPMQQRLELLHNYNNRQDMEGAGYGHFYNQTGLLLMPPTDEALTLTVFGIFSSIPLQADGDVSFWTMLHPFTLVHAAMYQLEVFYRNTEGARGWLEAISLALNGLNNDDAAEAAVDLDVMEDV
jgi:hypothetical protein